MNSQSYKVLLTVTYAKYMSFSSTLKVAAITIEESNK
jgi:hypothetical protein